MDTYHYFSSESRAALHGFTDDASGAKLPAEDGPWRLVRTVDPGLGWAGPIDLSAVEAGVRVNGFFLFESDAPLHFDETPHRAKDFM